MIGNYKDEDNNGKPREIEGNRRGVKVVAGSDDKVTGVTINNTTGQYAGTATNPVCVGGSITFTDIMRLTGGSGLIQTLKLIDKDNVKAPLVLLLFNQPLTGTYTDKQQPVFSTADADNFAGLVKISSADYVTAGNPSRAFADVPAQSKLTEAASTTKNLYGVLLTTGTVTYTTINILTLKLGAMRG